MGDYMGHRSQPEDIAAKGAVIRRRILDVIHAGKKGHIGGCFSCADILAGIYYGGQFRLSPEDHADRFLLSKGHCAAALYAVLFEKGYFDEATLATYGKNGSLLGAHPDSRLPGVDLTSGSLGMGLGIAAGLSLADRMDGRESRTVVLTGDGECYEGSVWEAAMFAAHHQLNRLLWIIDRNMLCVLDGTEDCNKLEPLADKIRAFGWDVQDADGHDTQSLLTALNDACREGASRPQAVIARTVKGKGVSFMENQLAWHHKVPNAEEYGRARLELDADGGRC